MKPCLVEMSTDLDMHLVNIARSQSFNYWIEIHRYGDRPEAGAADRVAGVRVAPIQQAAIAAMMMKAAESCGCPGSAYTCYIEMCLP